MRFKNFTADNYSYVIVVRMTIKILNLNLHHDMENMRKMTYNLQTNVALHQTSLFARMKQ